MADSDLIQMSNVVWYLGRFFDQLLTFTNHINQNINATMGTSHE